MSAAYTLPSSAVRVPHWKHHWLFHNSLQLLPPLWRASVSSVTLKMTNESGFINVSNYLASRSKCVVITALFSIFALKPRPRSSKNVFGFHYDATATLLVGQRDCYVILHMKLCIHRICCPNLKYGFGYCRTTAAGWCLPMFCWEFTDLNPLKH